MKKIRILLSYIQSMADGGSSLPSPPLINQFVYSQLIVSPTVAVYVIVVKYLVPGSALLQSLILIKYS